MVVARDGIASEISSRFSIRMPRQVHLSHTIGILQTYNSRFNDLLTCVANILVLNNYYVYYNKKFFQNTKVFFQQSLILQFVIF